MKFNAHGPEGLIDRKPPGQPSRLERRAPRRARRDTESGSDPASCSASCAGGSSTSAVGSSRNSGKVVAKQTLSRELRAMGYRKLSARPRHHEQAEGAIEDFKKLFRAPGRDRAARRASSPPP